MNYQSKPDFYIMAANGKENEFMNELNQLGLSYKEVEGSYKGIKERSFIIIDEGIDEAIIEELAQSYKQESYLKVVTENRDALLVFTNGGYSEPIGNFTAVSKDEALSADAYTYDSMFSQYYLAK